MLLSAGLNYLTWSSYVWFHETLNNSMEPLLF